MGTIKQGIFGEFTGKVGNVVGYTRNGANHVRIKAQKVHNPQTEKQQKQRGRFAAAMRFLKAVNPFIRTGYKNYAGKRTSYNAALSYLMSHAVKGNEEQNEIDFRRAMVSIGFLMPALDASATQSEGKMTFQWTDNTGTGNAEATDIAMILIYNSEKGTAIYRQNAAIRTNGKAELPIPQEWDGNTLVPYLSFCSADGEEVSNSICLLQENA